MSSQQKFLETRRKGIGGTDISAILGVNPYRTAFDVFVEKTGALVQDIRETMPIKMGKILEPVIASLYSEVTQRQLEECPTLFHPKYNFILGNPDRLIINDDLGLEIKTLRMFYCDWGEEYTDKIPLHYFLQVTWYMMLTKREAFDVAALASGQDFRIYRVYRNTELEELLLEKAIEFWEKHIVTNTPPVIDGSESTANYLISKFPRNINRLKQADSEAELWAKKLIAAKTAMGEIEEEYALAENNLKLLIGDSEGIKSDKDNWKVTWKCPAETEKINWEAVAKELGATQEIISKHTAIKQQPRRFLFSINQKTR